jgi:RimJ/RimL family protein N-acetyltransferase
MLETERLVLRRHRLDDLDDCVAMWGDPQVTRFIGGKPSGREDVWSRLLRYVGHWSLMGFGFWVLREKTSGRFVGEVGFAEFKRDLALPLEGVPEIGWALATWAHGQGLATEAVRAALAWGDACFGTRRTVCMIDPGNVASIRVAEKVGYRELARVVYKGLPTLIFERLPGPA